MKPIKIKKKSVYTLLLAVLLLGIDLFLEQINGVNKTVENENLSEISEESVKVERVIDGDTLVLENGQKVRYIGIDSPETTSKDETTNCFAELSLNKNKELVEGKMVKLEKDISETDKFDRLLRYVFVDGLFVNEYLVKEGYAKVSTFPPDVKYQEVFKNEEKTAREDNKGLWGTICP